MTGLSATVQGSLSKSASANELQIYGDTTSSGGTSRIPVDKLKTGECPGSEFLAAKEDS